MSQIFKIQRITRGRAAAAEQQSGGRKSSKSLLRSSSCGGDKSDFIVGMSNLRRRRGKSSEELSSSEGGNYEHEKSMTFSPSITGETDQDHEFLPHNDEESSQEGQAGMDGPALSPSKPSSVLPPGESHHSIFEPVRTELGKRKRAYHDYSLFLKIPKKSPKPVRSDIERRRRTVRLKDDGGEGTSGGGNEGTDLQSELYHQRMEDQISDSAGGEARGAEVASKKMRKVSVRGNDHSPAESVDSPRRKVGRRKSTSAAHHHQLDAPPMDASAISSELETSGFVDDQGNVVNIEQTSDGGCICPVENCGKHFRKESLLQMHLKHYHPSSKIQYLGKKMNVFEMAIANARRGSNGEESYKELPPPSPEHHHHILPSKSRRRSSPISGKSLEEVDSCAQPVPVDLPSEQPPTEPAASTSEAPTANEPKATTAETPKINTNVCVLLEKINLSHYNQSSAGSSSAGRPSSARVSHRGRILPPRRWGRDYSDVESVEEDYRSSEDESEFVISSSPAKRKAGRISRRSVVTAPDASRRRRRDTGGGGGGVTGGEDSIIEGGETVEDGPAAASSYETKADHHHQDTKKMRRPFKQSSSFEGVVPRGPGRPPTYARRGKRFSSKNTLLCGMKGKKLELIADELLSIDKTKKIAAKPRFEDVKVDVINCECGQEEEFGLMMQCELCQAWQHGNCYDIFEVTQLPRYYVCSFCREPKNLRQSSRHEWYQEVNTTGRLPRFSWTKPNDPQVEDRMRGTNDLLNCLTAVQSLLRSTQNKISLLNSVEDNPKLVLWSKEQDNPIQVVQREEFKLNFRAILRHLLKQNGRDPAYIAQLRNAVEEHVQSHPSAETSKVEQAVKRRLNSRAWRMIMESEEKEKKKWNDDAFMGMARVENVCEDHSASSCYDEMENGHNPPISNSSAAGVAGEVDQNSCGSNSNSSSSDERINKLKADLEEKLREGKCTLVEQEDRKFIILSRNYAQRGGGGRASRQRIRATGPSLLRGVLGFGKVTEPVEGVEGLSLVQLEDSTLTQTSQQGQGGEHLKKVDFKTVDKLKFCKHCKRNLQVNWSRKEFVDQTGVCVTSMPAPVIEQTVDQSSDPLKELTPDEVSSILPPAPPVPPCAEACHVEAAVTKEAKGACGVKSLKDLCEEELRKIGLLPLDATNPDVDVKADISKPAQT